MADRYPIVFEASANVGRPSAGPEPWPSAGSGPWPWPWLLANGPSTGGWNQKFTVEIEALAGQECHEFVLAQVKSWPETKTEWDMRCVTVFGHKICTKVPVLYHRSCTLEIVVDVCYPTGFLQDVEACVTGAAMASAIAAVISGGSAAAGTFKAALEACLLAKGAKWANEVTVNVPGPKTVCGPWHPV
jgi:hypothetical protein